MGTTVVARNRGEWRAMRREHGTLLRATPRLRPAPRGHKAVLRNRGRGRFYDRFRVHGQRSAVECGDDEAHGERCCESGNNHRNRRAWHDLDKADSEWRQRRQEAVAGRRDAEGDRARLPEMREGWKAVQISAAGNSLQRPDRGHAHFWESRCGSEGLSAYRPWSHVVESAPSPLLGRKRKSEAHHRSLLASHRHEGCKGGSRAPSFHWVRQRAKLHTGRARRVD